MKKRPGRKPQPLSKAVKDRICRDVSLGKSLRRVLKGEGMPSMSKVMETLQEDLLFAEQYARARKRGIDLHIDGILDLADRATATNVHAVRLKVDVRKWLASKLVPKVYGDRLDPEEDPALLEHRRFTALEAARRVAFVLFNGMQAAPKPAPPAPPAPPPAPPRLALPPPAPEPRYRDAQPRPEVQAQHPGATAAAGEKK